MNLICTHYFFISGFEKGNAAKRLEALKKKLVLDCDRDRKELSVRKGNSLVKTQCGPESCARGILQYSQIVVSISCKICTNEVFEKSII
jgi:hypothetical protein